MVVLGSLFVVDSYLLDEVSDAPGGLPYRFVIKSALPIGFLLLALQSVSTVAKQMSDPGGSWGRRLGSMYVEEVLAVLMFVALAVLLFSGYPVAFVLPGVALGLRQAWA